MSRSGWVEFASIIVIIIIVTESPLSESDLVRRAPGLGHARRDHKWVFRRDGGVDAERGELERAYGERAGVMRL